MLGWVNAKHATHLPVGMLGGMFADLCLLPRTYMSSMCVACHIDLLSLLNVPADR